MKTAPRLDLHRHLDGNIRVETILELADKNNIRLPASDVEGLRPYVTVTSPQPGLMEFIEKFHWAIAVLATPDDCRRVARENVEDAARERLDYVELRFSPWFMASAHGLNPAAVVEAVTDGIEQGVRDFSVPAKLIGILSRTFGPQTCAQELDALLAFQKKLVAIDLAGDEAGFPPNLFQSHFARVRDAGLQVTVHAGEAAGSESIWQAIQLLGATRIGHGVRATEDPKLLDYLGENQIGIECCPTSNVQTSTVRDYAAHPLRQFLEIGLLATINTDDPGISNITLDHEFEIAAPLAGLSADQTLQARQNTTKIAFDF